MTRFSPKDDIEPQQQKRRSDASIINLADARRQSRGQVSSEVLQNELEEIRSLLDQGLASQAQSHLSAFLKTVRHDPSLTAKAQCALAVSYEMQGRWRESLEAVQLYEKSEENEKLNDDALACVRVQTGLAYNYTGDHPKAIAILNTALHEATENESDLHLGNALAALARVYRSINEYTIARDYARRALDHFRHTGDWRGLAEAWFGVAMADFYEGRWEPAMNGFEQALNLIGDRPAAYQLGKIYNNLAGTCWFLKRPHDGIRYLEKAIGYYEGSEHKGNAADGYNNLGINLILTGQWPRAQEALERALALASEIDERGAKLPMILSSLGELHLLRGEFDESQQLLERAVSIATDNGNEWYESQALRTLSHCHLAMNQPDHALGKAQQSLALGERIGDRQAVCEARLLLAEARLDSGNLAACAAELQLLTSETGDAHEDLAITGEAQRLHGLLTFQQGDALRAAQHFGRSLSIFEMLGDRYRTALAEYWLGRANVETQPERALEHLEKAARSFRELGAQPALQKAEESLAAIDRAAPARQSEAASLIQLLTLRLTEAVTSRELLLRELASVLREETNAQRVMIAEAGEEQFKVVTTSGWNESEAAHLAAQFGRAKEGSERERFASAQNLSVITVNPGHARPAFALIAPRGAAMLPFGLSLESLLRIVELGLDTCALREKERAGSGSEELTAAHDQSLMPGFIHSSPAMNKLIDEIRRIRSSNVTVLITGESGTGKELVARAIHSLSSRRAKVFVPFNCTAVPKELSDAYLFGYRRGAFTGAVADSPGVIRAAAGGTLFLDEVGDLPLDIQPKLLRFLQEGEIQPLGEQRPIKVDVRIIAATNSALEEMVAAGRFREDLYYRLNVIRLKVPPLRERRSEIPAIVNHYVRHYSEKFGRRDVQISPQTLDLLMVCDWPGNVRQLTNEIQRIVARAEDNTLLTPDHLSPELRRTAASLPVTATSNNFTAMSEAFWQTMTMPEALDHLERLMIADALRKTGGNISRAARELGITRRGLQLKLGRYQMSSEEKE